MPSSVRLGAWLLLLGGALVGLLALGDGALATPPLTEGHAWSSWAQVRDPVVVALALLRLAALVMTWYLVGVTLVGTAARILRSARLVAAADVLTVPAVRRILQGALGLGLATAALASAGTPAAAPTAVAQGVSASGAPLVMHPLAPADPLVLEPLPPADEQEDVLREPAGDEDAGDAGDAGDVEDVEDVEEPHAGEPDGTSPPDEWVIGSGEHLWAVAEGALTRAWGRVPVDDEVERYWRSLIEANSERLADPANPDLVFPGQRFVLPEVPPEEQAGAVR